MQELAIVILNWNGLHWLKQFLPNVVACSPEGSVVVADNASTDESVSWLSSHFPDVRRILLNKNYGFAEGYNLALKQVDAEYVLLLNSDVEVTPNWTAPLLQCIKSDEKLVAVQPKIKAYLQKTHFEYAGAAGGFIDLLGYPFCRGRIFDKLEEDLGQYDNETDIFWASGACMLIRLKAFIEQKGFHPGFFAHMEEIDLCWRWQHQGYRLACCPESVVYHVGAGTLKKLSPFKTYLNFRNGLWMLFRNLPQQWFWARIFLRMCLDGIAGVQFLFKGQISHTWAIIRAHGYLYRHLNVWLQERKTLSLRHQQKGNLFVFNKLLVWQSFILGKKTFDQLHWNKH